MPISIPNSKLSTWWMAFSLLVLSAGLYLCTAAHPALIDEDVDAAHALVSREMLQRHDYVVMYMDGVRYLIRPPMHFWLVAASYKMFGETEFATRLPNALAMIGIVLLTFEFGRRFLGRRAGLYGALAAATSVGMFIFTRDMIPEAIYTLAFEGIFYLFLRAWTGSLNPKIGYWGAAALCAAAVLTRALIGLLFPVMAIVVFITITGGWRRWRELHLFSSASIFLILAAPWHILAGIRSPGFFWAYFINEHLNRALGTRLPHDYSAVPLWLWWSAHLVWLFPWSFFFPLALRELPLPLRAWKTDTSPGTQARLLLFTWLSVILLFFTFEGSSRMEYYSFSAWPAMCLLLGSGIAMAEISERNPTGQKWLPSIQGVLAALAVVFACVAGYFLWITRHIEAARAGSTHYVIRNAEQSVTAMIHLLDLTRETVADLRVPILISSLSLLIAFLVAWLLRERKTQWLPTAAMSVGMTGFIIATQMAFGVLNPTFSSRSLALELNKNLRFDDQIAIFGDIRVAPSIAFYSHRNVLLLDATGSNLEFGSHYPDAPKRFFGDADFCKLWQGTERVFLVAPAQQQDQVRESLHGNPAWVFAESGGKTVYVNRVPDTQQSPVGSLEGRLKLESLPK